MSFGRVAVSEFKLLVYNRRYTRLTSFAYVKNVHILLFGEEMG
jgi:hypothetical protein